MSSSIREFVMSHPLFSHHDHHASPRVLETDRGKYGYRSLLSYAEADLVTAAGVVPPLPAEQDGGVPEERIAELWAKIRTTGYGRAVSLTCKTLFDLDYEPGNFEAITAALQASLEGKSGAEMLDHFVREKANNKWVLHDFLFNPENEEAFEKIAYPDYYRFAFRLNNLFTMTDVAPLQHLERASGISVLSLDSLVAALNATIDRFKATGRLAALKVPMAYDRDMTVGNPTRHDAEKAFYKLTVGDNARKKLNEGSVSAAEARPLGDYLLHKLIQRAADENIPVQVHTGYLAGNSLVLSGTRAMLFEPVFDRYRSVRFDVFHASWPWTAELGAVAKSCPNVYPDLCWTWSMNPAGSERTLSEWLDSVPFNKIFGYGADTVLPWTNVGYSLQARAGIARVLERKTEAGCFSPSTAEEVASAIMLRNGEEFYGLG